MRIMLLLTFLMVSFIKESSDLITFKTRSGEPVIIKKDIIYFHKKGISQKIDGIVYKSKYNKIIEQHSTIFLFLEIDDTPNYNKIRAFKLTNKKAIQLAECVYNDKKQGIGPAPFTDLDGDSNLEFGGFDLTEFYSAKDSMYYNPSKYYQIKNGSISFDLPLTKKMDIKINGIYVSKPLDQSGNCCIVIAKPTKKSSYTSSKRPHRL
jgi:hypothetical protein